MNSIHTIISKKFNITGITNSKNHKEKNLKIQIYTMNNWRVYRYRYVSLIIHQLVCIHYDNTLLCANLTFTRIK